MFAVAVLKAIRPNIQPIIDRARPYIGDWFGTGYLVVPGAPPA